MYFLCIVHAPPSPEFSASLAPGYGLTRRQLTDVLPQIAYNLPITVEHFGIFKSFQLAKKRRDVPLPSEVEEKLEELTTADGRNAIVGRTVDAFQTPSGALYAVYEIDKNLSAVEHLVLSGILLGVSLTHTLSKRQKDSLITYELTLCTEPARPGSYTFVADEKLLPILLYKREMLSKSQLDISTNTFRPKKIMSVNEAKDVEMVDAAKTPIEKAFDSIPDENTRNVIAARLTQMVQKLDAEQAARKQAEEHANSIVKASKVNEDMLKTQLSLFQKQLGEKLCSSYCLDDESTHRAIDTAKENPAALLQVFDRAMVAASRKFMESSSETTSRKRKAEPETISPEVVKATESVVAEPLVAASASVEEEPAAVDTSNLSASDMLKRAMAMSFDC